MFQTRLSTKARQDLFEIETYTRANWGAEKVAEMEIIIKQSLTIITENPYQAKYTRKEKVFVKVLTKIPFLIVYKITKETIFIIRILHNKRNR